jgi:glycosyltransferase involved in cell wall biosynthesis
MHIWFVQRWEPTPIDDQGKQRLFRTGSMINAVLEDNHSVVWWTSTLDHHKKKNRFKKNKNIKISSNYEINFIHTKGYKKNNSPIRYLDNILLSYSLLKEFKKSKKKPDLIIASFPVPEIVFASIYFAKLKNIKTIIDIRDLWPDTILDKFNFLKSIISIFFIPMKIINNYIFSNTTAIIGNTNQFIKWGINCSNKRTRSDLDLSFNMGYIKKKYSTLEYNDAKSYWDAQKIIKDKNFIIASFFGTIGYNFDFDLILNAAKICADKKIKIKFIICGDGLRLKELIRRSKHIDNILFTGWLGGAEIQYLNEISDIGLAPYYKTKNFIDNLPNKPTEYMCGKNIIALSLSEGAMYNLITDFSCGFSYTNEKDLVDKISNLIKKPKVLKKMKLNSFEVYKNHLDGKKIYKEFSHYLKKFEKI